jgi:hypothetical protein
MFTDGTIEQQSELKISKNMLVMNGIDLPIGIINRTYVLLEQTEIVRTQAQAKELAAKRLAEKKKNQLASVEILSANEKDWLNNGKYSIKGIYTCIEDICMEEQLIVE